MANSTYQTAKDSTLNTSNNTSVSFKTAKDSSCCCMSDGSESFGTAAGSPITVPPLDKSKLPFGVLMRKLQRKMVRRDAPKGEDLEGILKVLGTIQGQDITVQEFMGLISPYTGDNGEVLRAVFNDDITSFKKMAKKVFETITQDNSDVLLNQQLTIGEYYCEKTRLLQRKMMEATEELFDLAPGFDFERYFKENERYLYEIFPVPIAMTDETEDYQQMQRQMAYQHLHWLRQEGDRLNAENEAMKERLNQVKVQAQDDNCRALDMEEEEEARRLALEEEEEMKRMEVEELGNMLESSIIRKEQNLRWKADASLHDPSYLVATDRSVPTSPLPSPKRLFQTPRRREWKQDTAQFIDYSGISSHSSNSKSTSYGSSSISPP